MYTLKKIDAWGQLVVIIGCLVFVTIFSVERALWSYFIVGGWQVMSALLQAFLNKKHLEVWDRKTYMWFLIITIITFPIGSYWLLIYVAPFTAIWYLSISFRELRIWQHRRFIQLR
jgi:hypothetical protein